MLNIKKVIAGQFVDQALKQLRENKEAMCLQASEYPPVPAALKLVKGDSLPEVNQNYKTLVQAIVQGIIEDVLKDPQKLKELVLSQV